MKRFLVLVLAASVAATSLVAIAQQTQQPGAAAQPTTNRGRMVDGVMATVNDQVISQSDVRNRMCDAEPMQAMGGRQGLSPADVGEVAEPSTVLLRCLK